VIPPEFISNANIQGKIKIKCGDEKCTGSITIKPKKNEESKTDISEQQK
jgi:hypothetical protein